MNESGQDVWFYTRGGERQGPVRFAELQGVAREGGLNPRLDMVWTQGMAEWKPAGEIEGLFEKREVAAETQAAAAAVPDPYQPPGVDALQGMVESGGEWPGARRRTFLIMTLLFPIAWQFGTAFGAGFLGQQMGPAIMGVALMALGLVPMVVAIYFGLERLANVGMSRWWYLGHLVPVLNLWVGYRTFACPAGYAYHKKLDGAGWFLAVVYWLMILLVLVFVGVVIALMFGAMKDPAMQQKLEEMLRLAREKGGRP